MSITLIEAVCWKCNRRVGIPNNATAICCHCHTVMYQPPRGLNSEILQRRGKERLPGVRAKERAIRRAGDNDLVLPAVPKVKGKPAVTTAHSAVDRPSKKRSTRGHRVAHR